MSSYYEREECPYLLCSARPTVVPTTRQSTGERARLIVTHDIQNSFLSGPCPARLMYVPLDAASQEHLRQIQILDERQLQVQQKARVQRSRSKPPKPPESQSLRQPGRMGREPEPNSPDWRATEHDPHSPVKHINPPGISGIGMSGRNMANVAEVKAQLQLSVQKSGEAAAELALMAEKLGLSAETTKEAATSAFIAFEGSGSSLAGDAVALYNEAESYIRQMYELRNQAENAILAAQEACNTYCDMA